MGLLKLDIKKVILVDHDKVSLRNLNRQFIYVLWQILESQKVQSYIKVSSSTI
jgi:molybdopterin/thiamine biosynthesis adenylyltransferase